MVMWELAPDCLPHLIRFMLARRTLTQFMWTGAQERATQALALGLEREQPAIKPYFQVVAGNDANSRIYLGDHDTANQCQMWYNNSNERFFLSVNGSSRMAVSEDGRFTFGTNASPASVGFVDVVAHSGTVMCSGVRGHLETKTAAANIYFDINQSTAHHVVLGSAANNLHANNTRVGDRFLIRLEQDGTGSRTVTAWFDHIKWGRWKRPHPDHNRR